jgi:hypothetical protein
MAEWGHLYVLCLAHTEQRHLHYWGMHAPAPHSDSAPTKPYFLLAILLVVTRPKSLLQLVYVVSPQGRGVELAMAVVAIHCVMDLHSLL